MPNDTGVDRGLSREGPLATHPFTFGFTVAISSASHWTGRRYRRWSRCRNRSDHLAHTASVRRRSASPGADGVLTVERNAARRNGRRRLARG